MSRHRLSHPVLRAVLWLAAGAALSLGCDKSPTAVTAAKDAAPDFALADVNPNSTTKGKLVSPRDYVGEISAYYFGHAT